MKEGRLAARADSIGQAPAVSVVVFVGPRLPLSQRDLRGLARLRSGTLDRYILRS